MNDGNEDEFYVYCGSETLGHTVRLELNGQTSICTSNCEVARPPWSLRPARLPIGLDVTLKRFRCASQQTGVLCTVIASGKGFLINSTGITRVG